MEERCLRSHAHANLLWERERQDLRIQFVERTKISIVLPINYRACLHGIISALLRKQRHVCLGFYGIGPRSINRAASSSFEHTCPIVRSPICPFNDFPRLLMNRCWREAVLVCFPSSIDAHGWILEERKKVCERHTLVHPLQFPKYKHKIIPLRITSRCSFTAFASTSDSQRE